MRDFIFSHLGGLAITRRLSNQNASARPTARADALGRCEFFCFCSFCSLRRASALTGLDACFLGSRGCQRGTRVSHLRWTQLPRIRSWSQTPSQLQPRPHPRRSPRPTRSRPGLLPRTRAPRPTRHLSRSIRESSSTFPCQHSSWLASCSSPSRGTHSAMPPSDLP